MADRSVMVRLRANASDFNRAMMGARTAVRGLRDDIDTSNDRVTWLAQSIMALGPTIAPLGASLVPVLSGLTTQLTMGAAAAGTVVLAFQGVGDAFTALNDYQLEPTAENFQKLQVAMEDIGPAGADFVRFLDEVAPKFDDLQMAAREGMFPGMEEGIRDLMDLLPQARRIVTEMSEGVGQLSMDAGAGLSGEGFRDFFNYIESDGQRILIEMGRTMGNFIEGLGAMIVAFAPASEAFSRGFLEMSRDFKEWAHGLEENETFTAFLQYIEESVPRVKDFLGSFTDAFVALLEAMAPVGDKMVPALTAFLDVLTSFLQTPVAPWFLGAAAAMGIYGRAAALASLTTGGLGKMLGRTALNVGGFSTAMGKSRPPLRQFGTAAMYAAHSNKTLMKGMQSGSKVAQDSARRAMMARDAVRGFGRAVAPVGAAVGILAFQMSDLDDKMGLTNTSMGAMLGLLAGPYGAAIGAAGGAMLDFKAAVEEVNDEIDRLSDVVRRSNLGEMESELSRVQTRLEDLRNVDGVGDFFGDLAGYLTTETYKLGVAAGELEGKIKRLREGAVGGKEALSELFAGVTEGANGTSDALLTASQSAKEFGESLARLNRFLEGRANMRDYQAALDDFTASMKENGRTFDINTQKGRDNQAALDGIVSTALNVAEGLKGIERVEFLQGTAQQVRQLARQFDIPKSQVRGLLRQLDDLGAKKAEAEVGVKGDEKARGQVSSLQGDLRRYGLTRANATAALRDVASGRINTIQGLIDKYGVTRAQAATLLADNNVPGQLAGIIGQLNDLNGKHASSTSTHTHTEIRRVLTQAMPLARGALNYFGSADGSTVPKDGGPYADRYPYLLAPGEEVITNRHGQADKHRPLLKAINAGLLADGGTAGIEGLANGGTAFRKARRQFDIGGGMTGREIAGELKEFRKAMREAGAVWTKAHVRVARQVHKVAGAYRLQERELEKTREQFKELRRERNQYRDQVSQSFSGDLFGNGLEGLRTGLAANRNDSRNMRNALRDAAGRGLDGELFRALAESGDLTTAQQFAQLSRSQIKNYEQLYASTTRAQNSLGAYSARQVYSPELKALRRSADKSNRVMARLDKRINNMEHRIERGARRGVQARQRAKAARAKR